MSNKTPSVVAMRIAEAYLKEIDGSDFGHPEDGHDITVLTAIVDGEIQPLVAKAEKVLAILDDMKLYGPTPIYSADRAHMEALRQELASVRGEKGKG